MIMFSRKSSFATIVTFFNSLHLGLFFIDKLSELVHTGAIS